MILDEGEALSKTHGIPKGVVAGVSPSKIQMGAPACQLAPMRIQQPTYLLEKTSKENYR